MILKKKFYLNEDNLTDMCNYFISKHPNVKISIEKSPYLNHNSFYLRFYIGKISCSLRISDHDTRLTSLGGGIRNIIVGKSTKNIVILNKFEETLKTLKWKIHRIKFDEIFKNIKN